MAENSKQALTENLKAFGFDDKYIARAFRVYEKNYGSNYDMNVITEIIVRLQNKDAQKPKGQKGSGSSNKKKDQVNISNNKGGSHASSPQQVSIVAQQSKQQQQQQPQQQQRQQNPQQQAYQNPPQPYGAQQGGGGGNNQAIGHQASFESGPPPPAYGGNFGMGGYGGGGGGNNNNNNSIHQNSMNSNMSGHSSHNQNGHMGGGYGQQQQPNQNGSQQQQQRQVQPPPPQQQQQQQQPAYESEPPPPAFGGGPIQYQLPTQPQLGNNGQQQGGQQQSQQQQQQQQQVQVNGMPNGMRQQQQQQQQQQAQQNGGNVQVVAVNGNNSNRKQQKNKNSSGSNKHQFSVGSYAMWKHQNFGVIPVQIEQLNGKIAIISYPLEQPRNLRQQENAFVNSLQPMGQKSSSSQPKVQAQQQQQQRQQQPPPPKQQQQQPNQQIQQAQSMQAMQTQQKTNYGSRSQTPMSNTNGSTTNGGGVPINNKNSTTKGGIPEFVAHLSLKECNNLRVHDKIDHRDQVGRFVFATVVEKHGSNLKVHYDGWSRKWDCYSDYRKEMHRFAKAGSISKRPAHRFKDLKKGDFIDLNPTNRHPGWRVGEIRRLDPKSGQVQVVYEYQDKNFLYWAHLDNKEEIAEFTSKSGTDQDLQNQIASQIASQNAAHGRSTSSQKSLKPKQQNGRYASQQINMGKAGDQMATFQYIRLKRFPKQPNEIINNPYTIGDWLEVLDVSTQQWITATVTDKENNWIVVHFDGWPNKYDQKIHVGKHRDRLRALGSGLAPDQMEIEIAQEMEAFLKGVKELGCELIEVDADGNCLYRAFATEIYGNTGEHLKVRAEGIDYMTNNKEFFQNFILDFDETIKQKAQQYEWGDHVDITALSELYNVRVRVFELEETSKKLYMSFDQGVHDSTVDLPLIMLGRHRKKHYNIITDPNAMHKRPLGDANARTSSITLRDIREKEEQAHVVDAKDDDEKNPTQGQKGKLRKVFDLDFEMQDFQDVMELVNAPSPLSAPDLETMFDVLLKQLHKKIAAQWGNMHRGISVKILDNFWESTFGQQTRQLQYSKWLTELKEKVHSDKFEPSVALSTFNSVIARSVAANLGSIVQTQKRISNVDELGANDMSQNPNSKLSLQKVGAPGGTRY